MFLSFDYGQTNYSGAGSSSSTKHQTFKFLKRWEHLIQNGTMGFMLFSTVCMHVSSLRDLSVVMHHVWFPHIWLNNSWWTHPNPVRTPSHQWWLMYLITCTLHNYWYFYSCITFFVHFVTFCLQPIHTPVYIFWLNAATFMFFYESVPCFTPSVWVLHKYIIIIFFFWS